LQHREKFLACSVVVVVLVVCCKLVMVAAAIYNKSKRTQESTPVYMTQYKPNVDNK
jgi:cell division protein FtsL